MSSDQRAELDWRDSGVPVSTRFDDPYFSLENGLAETRHVFLDGNDLPSRYRDGFHIAELGFGTGLNLLAALQTWQEAGCTGTLHFTSFEAFPVSGDDMARALAAFPALADISAPLVAGWAKGQRVIALEGCDLRVIEGDARQTLATWQGCADAWFLDGFSPAKNPELWDEALMTQVGRHTATDGTFATYTAAGHVRRGLSQAGFTVTRVPGYGRKRHMTIGRMDP